MKITSFQLVRWITSQGCINSLSFLTMTPLFYLHIRRVLLHAHPVQHAYTLVLPLVSDIIDDSIHSDYVHGNKQVEQEDKKPTLKLQ
jgi:hypothetical protein